MKIGDLARLSCPERGDLVGVIVKKHDRDPAWSCNMWTLLVEGELLVGTDYNLEAVQ